MVVAVEAWWSVVESGSRSAAVVWLPAPNPGPDGLRVHDAPGGPPGRMDMQS